MTRKEYTKKRFLSQRATGSVGALNGHQTVSVQFTCLSSFFPVLPFMPFMALSGQCRLTCPDIVCSLRSFHARLPGDDLPQGDGHEKPSTKSRIGFLLPRSTEFPERRERVALQPCHAAFLFGHVHGLTVGTDAFAGELPAAVAADVARAVVAEVVPQCPESVDGQEQVADVVEGGEAEDDVVDGTHAAQSQEVEQGIDEGQAAESVVDGGNGDDEHGPHRDEEQHQQRRLCKGVECGVEIEVPPCVGGKQLDGGVERGREGYGDGEHGGIERRDVSEMHDVGIAPDHHAQAIGRDDDRKDDEEPQQVGIREKGDELGYGVVGIDGRQKLHFVRPAYARLVACQLHPNRVNGIVGKDTDVGNDQPVVLVDHECVDGQVVDLLLGQLADEGQGVVVYHEVEVVAVVMLVRKHQRVAGNGRHDAAGLTARMVARRQQHEQQQGEKGVFILRHRHSFGIDGNRTTA